jgi:hypothetical protein
MGDDVGKQLENIITRGQMAQRIQINPFELQGRGSSSRTSPASSPRTSTSASSKRRRRSSRGA